MKRVIAIVALSLLLASCTQELQLPDGYVRSAVGPTEQECVTGQSCRDDESRGKDNSSEALLEADPELEDVESEELLSTIESESTEEVEPRAEPTPEATPQPRAASGAIADEDRQNPAPQVTQSPVEAEPTPTPTETPAPDVYTVKISAPETISSGSTLRFEITVSHPTKAHEPNGSRFNVSYEGPGLMVDTGSGWLKYESYGKRSVTVLLAATDTGVCTLRASFSPDPNNVPFVETSHSVQIR